MRRLALIGVVAVLAGCAREAAPQLFFPRHDAPRGEAAADEVLEAELAYSNGCFFLDVADGTRYLAVWPANIEPRMWGTATVVGPGRDLLLESGAIGFVAGHAVERADAEEQIGAAVPERCAADIFWVGDVVDRP